VKQVLQSLRNGKTSIAKVPAPRVKEGQVLIKTSKTLVSLGTEGMLVEFGKSNIFRKIRQQPDKVQLVLNKIRTDGLLPTIEAVFNKLNTPLPLGYCNVGEVIGVGAGASGLALGDRVVSNGRHAEIVSVPFNLCSRIPQSVPDDTAVFTILGAVALQGIRLIQPTLGEVVVVMGLGILGQSAVQLLRANGCQVIAIDFQKDRLKIAESYGAITIDLSSKQNAVDIVNSLTKGQGVDAVLITASTTSNVPVQDAARMCRKRGRIVLVGVAGLELSRALFYEKELSFQVSCSYGPGRYEREYEEEGIDYPIGHVRWTEKRNFEAVLGMMSDGKFNTAALITHRYSIDVADKAYDLINTDSSLLGIIIEYPKSRKSSTSHTVELTHNQVAQVSDKKPVVSFIGSGNYAQSILVPAFKTSGVVLQNIASSEGVSGFHVGKKFGFKKTTTDVRRIIEDPDVDVIVIASRHNTHAEFVFDALCAGKHIFVEKPLCMTLDELTKIEEKYYELRLTEQTPILMVGFNRRFSPHVIKIKELLRPEVEPKTVIMTVNAGPIDARHWTLDSIVGGGRILGESCHFVDLLRFIVGKEITDYGIQRMGGISPDTATLSLNFEDGSIGTIHYLTNGTKSFPKERLEVFVAGKIIQLDNFRKIKAFGWSGFSRTSSFKQDKGQINCVKTFVDAVKVGGNPPIPFEEIIEVSQASIKLASEIS
jgi:predicted dehydrogenase/threonine dehydrogenase-like Zn-dependent dehydrogenase